MKTNKIPRLAIGFVLVLGISGERLASAQSPTRVVAVSGDPAPGTELGVAFSVLSTPVINDVGQTAFAGTLTGSSNNRGIWSESSGALDLVARSGTPAPGFGADVAFSQFQDPVLNNVGQVAFTASLSGPGLTTGYGEGIWATVDDDLTLVARQGDVAPGGNSAFSSFGSVLNNDMGQLAFWARLVDPVTSQEVGHGVYIWDSGNLHCVAHTEMQAPGLPSDVRFSWINPPVLNSAGDVAFNASLDGPGVVRYVNDTGIWSGGNLLVRGGDPVPGMPNDVVYRRMGMPAVNDSGEIVFRASISGTGIDGSNDVGVWSGSPGSFSPVAQEGTQAPGAPGSFVFNGEVAAVINGTGSVAFWGRLSEPALQKGQYAATWAGEPGNLTMIQCEGQQAPDTPEGVVFGGYYPLPTQAPTLNAAGEVAFAAFLSGPGISEANDQAIWAGSPAHLRVIVREGDNLETSPGVLKTVSNVAFRGSDPIAMGAKIVGDVSGSGGQDGRKTGLSDGGQLAYWAEFSDDTTGVFVTDVVKPTGEFKALLIGGLGNGRRGDTDCDKIRAALGRFGVEEGNIRQVTLDVFTPLADVAQGIGELNVKAGDSLLVYYAGHGNYDLSDDSEPTIINSDTVIREYGFALNSGDEQLSGEIEISDDWLAGYLNIAGIQDAKKLVILDSCFSGGFWGKPGNESDLGDLDKVPNTAIIASATEGDLSYYYPSDPSNYWYGSGLEGRGLMSVAMEAALNDLADDLDDQDVLEEDRMSHLSYAMLRTAIDLEYTESNFPEFGAISAFPWLDEEVVIEVGELSAFFAMTNDFGPDEAFLPVPKPPIMGDLNGDGYVGSHDLDIVRSHWGGDVTPGDLTMGDISGDGYVGSADLDIVRANWGVGVATVPEPSTSLFVLVGAVFVAFRRRR